MSTSVFLVLVLALLVTGEAEPATEFMEASDGGTASLPCNLTPVVTPDKISVVLWYKGVDESPIYKYDLRGSQPVRWADSSLQNRFFLRILDDNRAAMSISPTRLGDEQMFHCRVDFLKSPTRMTRVNLTIIAPARVNSESYDEIIAILSGHFAPRTSEMVCRFKFYRRSQQPEALLVSSRNFVIWKKIDVLAGPWRQ
ncbi:unnamed protein product [Phaedon cochleariae]|uniref:Ig-like domain-containing protein n=1 Tax=Phaedon cochleariae TaxID=80249 RepID=A0A9N9WZU5_PHACE|nr:unnamed protein product [Phaedon cochleariae]